MVHPSIRKIAEQPELELMSGSDRYALIHAELADDALIRGAFVRAVSTNGRRTT